MNSGVLVNNVGAAVAGMNAPAWGGQGILGQGQMSGQINMQSPPTLAEQISAMRTRAKSKDSVLEYIQAQLNMDLFKGDEYASMCFLRAMTVAFQELSKVT